MYASYLRWYTRKDEYRDGWPVLEEVEVFKYLGSLLTAVGGVEADVHTAESFGGE